MRLLLLAILFIVCISLPSMLFFLEGMEYTTELLDNEEKYRTLPEERILYELKDLSFNEILRK